MEYQKHFFSGGTPRTITIALPSDDLTVKYPAVILCHGHSRHKNDGLDALSQVLTGAGFVTARFDFRGCCDGHDQRYILNCATDWPEDLMNAISYIGTLPFIDKDRIGAAGISMGAATSVYVSGMDDRIKSTVSMGGIGDCFTWMRGVWEKSGGRFDDFLARLDRDRELTAVTGHSQVIHSLDMYNGTEEDKRNLLIEGFLNSDVNTYVTLASLRNMLYYRPLEKCPHIRNPIFFAHGGDDLVVPVEQSRRMYEAVASGRKQFKEYPGVEHNIPMDPNRMLVFEDMKQWFTETL